jgi:hypothetical protein
MTRGEVNDTPKTWALLWLFSTFFIVLSYLKGDLFGIIYWTKCRTWCTTSKLGKTVAVSDSGDQTRPLFQYQ